MITDNYSQLICIAIVSAYFMSSRLTHWNLKWVCYVHILITINTYFLCTHLSVLFLCDSALTTKGECGKTWENAAEMLFVFPSMVLSRHLGARVWVWSVPDGRRGNTAKDLNVLYQGSGRTFHLWNALSVWSVFCGHSDSWSVFLLRWKRTRKDVFIWVHVFCANIFSALRQFTK